MRLMNIIQWSNYYSLVCFTSQGISFNFTLAWWELSPTPLLMELVHFQLLNSKIHQPMNEAIYIHNFLMSIHVGMLTLITNYLKECLNKMLCHALQSLLVILHMGILKLYTNCLKECLNEMMYDGIILLLVIPRLTTPMKP